MLKSQQELQSAYSKMPKPPVNEGIVEMLVCRPGRNERRVLKEAVLSADTGLSGDNWLAKGSRHTSDGKADLNMQLTLMNARVIELIAGSKSTWPLAGDQLFVNFDLSENNVPAGTRLRVGTAIVEVTAVPHLGCLKFSKRFGKGAMEFVNSALGKSQNLRGINAKVVVSGVVRVGDHVIKLAQTV